MFKYSFCGFKGMIAKQIGNSFEFYEFTADNVDIILQWLDDNKVRYDIDFFKNKIQIYYVNIVHIVIRGDFLVKEGTEINPYKPYRFKQLFEVMR